MENMASPSETTDIALIHHGSDHGFCTIMFCNSLWERHWEGFTSCISQLREQLHILPMCTILTLTIYVTLFLLSSIPNQRNPLAVVSIFS